MGEATAFVCDQCGKGKISTWAGPPKGWVRLEASAVWDGTNYHISGGKSERTFCSIKCFVEYMRRHR